MASYATQINPQQNPQYQRAMNPPGQNPAAGPQSVDKNLTQDDNGYLNRLRARVAPGSQTPRQSSRAQFLPTATAGSGVTANGKLAPMAQQPVAYQFSYPTQMQQPAQQSQPAQQPTQVTAPPLTVPPPTTPDPFAAMGGGVWTGQQWLPKDHPLAQQFLAQQTPQSSNAGLPPGAQPGYQTTQGLVPTYVAPASLTRPANTIYQPGQIQIQLPDQYVPNNQMSIYQGGTLTQWQAPDQSAITQAQTDLLQRVLANPESLSPEVVAALREREKSLHLQAAKQQQEAAAAAMAARGLDPTLSGQAHAVDRRIQQDALNAAIAGMRDIDIAAAQTNLQDRLAALAAAEGVLSGQFGRASESFRNTLAGQTAQEEINRAAVQSAQEAARFREANRQAAQQLALARAGLDFDVQARNLDELWRASQSAADAYAQDVQFGLERDRFALDRLNADRGFWLDQGRLDLARLQSDRDYGLDTRRIDLQAELGRGGLALDERRLTELARQFNLGHQLDVLRFLEDRRQFDRDYGLRSSMFNDEMAYRWAGLNAEQEANYLRFLLGL